jgi:pyridoxal phosphate enzyme (YggS family)
VEAAATTPAGLASRLATVRGRIESAGGDPERVTLLAVTKGFGAGVVQAAVAAGLRDIGESYVQELVAKAAELEELAGEPDAVPTWHFVGGLQRNKVRKAAPHVAVWHSVDRLSLGAEIARCSPGAAVYAQVNTTDEPQKGGCEPARLPALVDGLRDLGLDVLGLMTIGPQGPPEAARPAFRLLRSLAEREGVAGLSMGMTSDLEVAVAEGATVVRVGSGLFGPRPVRPGMRH